ncbi:MAG: thioredoxin-disulfide reductase [Streptococcaceae bacterium]|nr:thioredoxin-disulfide reductase [Streptococcaceae bacterium]
MYDVIVIGSGPAGMTAALYAARSDLKTLLIERGAPGGQMNNTAEIENYPGFNSIIGPDLAYKMYEPLARFGVENVYGDVVEVINQGAIKVVKTEDAIYETKALIIATGAVHRHLNVLGEAEYAGRGVSYCAVCDGAFFREKELIVVGGGDSAVEEAIYLTRFASKVTIVHRRDELRAQKIIQERAFKNEKIAFIWDSVVDEIYGNDKVVTGVKIKNVKTNEMTDVPAGGVFIYVGLDPITKPFEALEITDNAGWIVTDNEMKTAVSGIFAVGDVRAKDLRQITTAVGEGGIAGYQVYKYLQ